MQHPIKIITSMIIAIVILVTCIPICAGATKTMTITADTTYAHAGDIVTVPIRVANNDGFVSASLIVSYDENIMTLTGVDDTGLIHGQMHSTHYSSPYTLTWVNDVANNSTSNGIIANLMFVLTNDVNAGQYPINISTVKDGILSADGTEPYCGFVNGLIIIEEQECAHTWTEWKKSSFSKHKRTCNLCGETEYGVHEWDDGVITKDATAATSGTMTYTCTVCNATRDEEIPALEHTHSYTVYQVVVPTCTAQGYTVYKCSDCGSTYQDNITEATGHNYSSVVVNPTCQKQGYTEHTCNKCGDSYKNNYVSTVEHKYESGKCTYCGAVNSDTPDMIPVTGITLSESSIEIKGGSNNYVMIDAIIKPENATNQEVTWKSSDTSVAGVKWYASNNCRAKITAENAGTAIITATTADGKYTAQCVVTVLPNTSVPTILIESDPLRAGQTADVRISLKNNPGVASMKLNLTYDTNILTLTDITYNSGIGGQSQQPQNYNSPVILNWFNGSADCEGDFLFATLTFTVSDEVFSGETTTISLTYDENDIYDISETNIYFYTPEFSAEITDYIPGDINGDNVVNNKDLTRLFQYLSGWNVETKEGTLDVNADGSVNNKDLTRLFQYLSGWNVEIH